MFNNILLVDDSDALRKATRQYLEAAGFQIVGEASNGFDAIELACTLKPDFVMLDLAMPGMNGFDAARKLHQMIPSTLLVLFTLYESLLNRPGTPDVGIEAVISKSDGISALAERLTGLIKRAP